jgi:hypothetical protein
MSRPTQDTANYLTNFVYRTLTSIVDLSKSFHYQLIHISQSYNPSNAETSLVWAVSVSLATTQEITLVFSSYAYLDVSVQRVRLLTDVISSI